jgi:phage terminase small subunit
MIKEKDNAPVGSKPIKRERYELFAQAMAQGQSVEKAYTAAGYRPSRAAGHVLRKKIEIQQRVAFLFSERSRVINQSTVEAIEQTALTKKWVIENLRENALKCLGKLPIKVTQTEGMPAIEEFDWQPGPANRALELLGRELNMFIERHEVGEPGEFARMSDAELSQALLEQAEKLEIELPQHLLTYQPANPEDDGEAE